jgi:hypothetical protein
MDTPQISGRDIQVLRYEAGLAGDMKMVAVCDRALNGDESARVVCEQVIRDADDYDWEDR